MDMDLKVLVIVEDYPRITGKKALMFVHTRNKIYRDGGVEVIVLNFSARENYIIDEIPVITYAEYLEKYADERFPVLIAHAANLRHHFRFINQHGENFENFIFFFHGHEILPINKAYPKPYNYVKESMYIKKIIQNIYDRFKFYEWRKFINKYIEKSQFIFVSQWMYSQFQEWINVDLKKRWHIIYNGVDISYEEQKYNFIEECEYEYDCITIRGNLDGAKYCMDIVNDFAKKNKDLRFLVIGRGDFFSHYSKSENIKWIDRWLNTEEIIEYLRKTKCALMPTKTDAQGLMMCEFATYGIPVITSDISVCKEVLEGFDNIAYISNENPYLDFKAFFKSLNKSPQINRRFFKENTVRKELDLLKKLLEEK